MSTPESALESVPESVPESAPESATVVVPPPEQAVEAKVRCTAGNKNPEDQCQNEDATNKMYIPGFDFLSKKLGGRPIELIDLKELEGFAICAHCHQLVTEAARKSNMKIEYYNLSTCVERQKQHRDRRAAKTVIDAAQANLSEQQKQLFKAKVDKYLATLRKNASADLPPLDALPEVINCVFEKCGHAFAGKDKMYVPTLTRLNQALGRDVVEGDLPNFALCFEHAHALEKRDEEMHLLVASIWMIAKNRPKREAAKQTKARVDDLLAEFAEPITWEDGLPDAPVPCRGEGCPNTIPAGKGSVCDSCKRKCKTDGCNNRIPKIHEYCLKCKPKSPLGKSPLENKTPQNSTLADRETKRHWRQGETSVKGPVKGPSNDLCLHNFKGKGKGKK